MKKTLLCFAFIMAAMLSACSSRQTSPAPSKAPETVVTYTTADGKAEAVSDPVLEELPKVSAPKEIPADAAEYTGKFLKSTGGDGILVIDHYGPVVFTYESGDRSVLDSLEDGDIISAKTGPIMETWPGQTSVYECTLQKKGKRNDVDPATLASLMEMGQIEKKPLPAMFYARDTLFTDTGRIAHPTCGTEDGRFTSIIDSKNVPAKDGQANFGSQNIGYIFLMEGAMAVKSGDGYALFLADGTVEYEGRFFKESELSSDVLTWLEFYNSLSKEEQAALSSVPFELQPANK